MQWSDGVRSSRRITMNYFVVVFAHVCVLLSTADCSTKQYSFDEEHTTAGVSIENTGYYQQSMSETTTGSQSNSVQYVAMRQWLDSKFSDIVNTCSDRLANEPVCRHVSSARFELLVNGLHAIMDLQLNEELLTGVLKQAIVTQPQSSVILKEITPENCYYRGRVRDMSESLVVLITCDHVRGLIVVNSSLYYIEPSNLLSLPYKVTPYQQRSSSTVHDVPWSTSPAYITYHYSEYLRNLKISKMHMDSMMRATRLLRLALVIAVDSPLLESLNDANMTVNNFLMEFSNLLSSLLLDVGGPKLVVVYTEANYKTNLFSRSKTSRLLLKEFLVHRQTSMNAVEFDIAHLLLGRLANQADVVNAIPYSICTRRSVSLSQIVDVKDVMSSAVAALHAISRVLGIENNKSDTCTCDSHSACLNVLSSDPLSWLPCSPSGLSRSTKARLDVCLYDRMAEATYVTTCGNGRVERGEECDCISKEECRRTDPCCDADLCMLVPWATCRHGDCCHNCTLRSALDVCRQPSSECDVPEFCDGKTGYCPSDALVQDGHVCLTGVGTCYNGNCVSYDRQCRAIWGSGARGAAESCYETFNVGGNLAGHCGWNHETNDYQKCTKQNMKCGLLHCTGGNSLPSVDGNHTFFVTTFVSGGVEYECKIVNAIDKSNIVHNPVGFVESGSMCHNGSLCINQSCVDLKSVSPLSCPIDENGEMCSGNGVCTSEVRCYCAHGFTGANCETRVSYTVKPSAAYPSTVVYGLPSFSGGVFNVTDNRTEPGSFNATSAAGHATDVGTLWLVFILASIVLVALVLFVVCLVCYRRQSPAARGKHRHKHGHKSHSPRPGHLLQKNDSQRSSRVKFHTDLPSYRAYKLRHFLRGSGASETDSERGASSQAAAAAVAATTGQNEATETDGMLTANAAAVQSQPLSAVDRLSTNPERGILKNSGTNNGTSRRSTTVTVQGSTANAVNDCQPVDVNESPYTPLQSRVDCTPLTFGSSEHGLDDSELCKQSNGDSRVSVVGNGELLTEKQKTPLEVPTVTSNQPRRQASAFSALRSSPVPASIKQTSSSQVTE